MGIKMVFLCVHRAQQYDHSLFELKCPLLTLVYQFRHGPQEAGDMLRNKLVFLYVHVGQQSGHGLFELWCPLLPVVN